MKSSILTLATLLTFGASAQAATIFNFTGSTGDLQADAAFDAAASMWSALLYDDVTINIQRGFSSLGSGILASTSNTFTAYTYSQLRSALVADATSSNDVLAVANLQAGPAVNMLLNRTANNPNGSGSATPYIDNDGDANNTTVSITNANAKALGLLGPSAAVDGVLNFNSAGGFTWDFNPLDGITAGAFDFMGIVAHEIGHLLGFVSGVDVLDDNSSGPFLNDNQFTFLSVLDLYRYSAASAASGVIDWTADGRAKYFSIDGGATSITTFSTGINFGDGHQASHWQDGLGLGVMDPTAAQGEQLVIRPNDILAMDVIGWNVGAAVPEPGTIGLSLIGFALLFAAKRKSRVKAT